ncbi:MAG: DinB family protein [Actinomycetota bacterium]
MNRRDELLAAENAGWQELNARLHRLGEDDWLRPGVNGDWTPKDLAAHVAVWHASATDRLEGVRMTGEMPPLPAPVDTINADQYERCRDLTLKEVRAMSGAARHRFREEIAQLPPEPEENVSMLIFGDGREHYDDHIPQLDAFLGGA